MGVGVEGGKQTRTQEHNTHRSVFRLSEKDQGATGIGATGPERF